MATTIMKEKLVSFLENRKVRIYPVKKKNPFATFSLEELDPKTGKYETKKNIPEQFNNTYKIITVPLDERTGLTKRILDNSKKVLSEQYPSEKLTEQEYFERELGLNPGDLDPEKSFLVQNTNTRVRFNNWNAPYSVLKLSNNPLDLDLSIPKDMLLYKVALANKSKIALSAEQAEELPLASHYISDLAKDEVAKAQTATKRFEALAKLMEIKNNIKEVNASLSLLTEKWYYSSELEVSFGKLFNMVEDNPEKFLRVISDVAKDAKLFIYQCVKRGEITVRNGNYVTIDGTKLGNLVESIRWYDEPENFAEIEKIKKRLEK